MTNKDLGFAARLTAYEGWDSSTQQELGALLEYDPQGCLIAEENRMRVGMCFGTAYRTLGFIGELIILESARGRGIGTQLMKLAIQDLHTRSIENIYLNGVIAALPLYERLGFRKVCLSLRMRGSIKGKAHTDIRMMQMDDLEAVLELDQVVFGDDRSFFIQRRFERYPQLCLVQEGHSTIVGYIQGRPGRQDISVGPWITASNNSAPQNLLESFAHQVGMQSLCLGILEANHKAVSIVESIGLPRNPGAPVWMVLGKVAYPGKTDQSYAIGSPSKG